MSTRVVLLRDGEEVLLVQHTTPRGLPKCVYCLKMIPAAYRRWSKWFCRDRCAVNWANEIAESVWRQDKTS
jgi:hypothetical protein